MTRETKLTYEDRMFIIRQMMRAHQCSGGSIPSHKKNYHVLPVSERTKEALCMNCRYAPAKHLP